MVLSNISDYLDWRSDVTFDVDPFNEIDNLILCQLSYINWEGILPDYDSGKTMSIEACCKKYFKTYSEEDIMARNAMTKMVPFLLYKMINTNRFGGMRIGGFVNTLDSETQTQFSVITFHLNDNSVFVAFRGTDNTVLGWKEDFNMSFMSQTAGQMLAVQYLNDNFNNTRKIIRVGGHSKGGNFAVYGAAFCKPNIRKKIVDVYSNDGPGFEEHILQKKEYKKLLPKVHSFIPEYSIVGMLMENEYDNKYVVSTNKGLMAHDAMSWQVFKNRFEVVEEVSPDSVLIAKTIKTWYKDVDKNTREVFLDILFTALFSQSNIVSDLTESPLKTLSELKKSVDALPEDQQKLFNDIIYKLIKSSQSVMTENLVEKLSSIVKLPDVSTFSNKGKRNKK